MKVKSLSRVRLLATPWTAAYQAPPPMGFSRQTYWSGCHCLLHASLLQVVYFILYSNQQCLSIPTFPPPTNTQQYQLIFYLSDRSLGIFIVILICIHLITNDFEYHFVRLSVPQVFTLMNCLCIYSGIIFLLGFISASYICSYLFI